MDAREGGEEREIALGVARALERALAPQPAAAALGAAREAAALLGLDALARLVAALEPHAGRPWPAELEPVRDRLARMAARAAAAGSVDVFRAEARELEGLAGEAGALEWSVRPAAGRRVATLSAAAALDDLPFTDEAARAAARRARLAPPVAAALRAALDWMTGEGGVLRPIGARAEDSAFEVTVAAPDPAALDAADAVIASVGGALGPALAPGESGWTVRVPAVSARDHFMMFEQGGLRLAVPWHAVLRLHVLDAADAAAVAARHGMPLLPPLAAGAAPAGEVPMIAIGLGLRRGWIAADRLVWRLAADAVEPEPGAREEGFERAVVTDDGEVWRVVSVPKLLEGVAPVVTARAVPAAGGEVAPPAAAARGDAPATAIEPAPGATARALSGEDVEGLPAEAGPVAAAPARERASFDPPPEALPPALVEAVGAARPSDDPAPPARRAAAPAGASGPDWRSRVVTEVVAPGAPPAPVPAAAPVAPQDWRSRVVVEVLAPAPAREAAAAVPAAAPVRAASPAPAASARSALTPADVEPLPASAPRRALVAEDSFAARAFLVRLLEQRGFEVEAVRLAADLDEALAAGGFGAVFVDVELPDARGASLLASVAARFERGAPPALVAALVRDADDEAAAARAGIAVTLRKPVDRAALDRALAAAGLPTGKVA
uniref:Response regulator n=1 Tax=Eiseniibacteriota bacterium TaxID=2212470 RepID=A0A832HYJ5_UNCEI